MNITRDEPLKIVTDTEEDETDREDENTLDERNGGYLLVAERSVDLEMVLT